MDDVSKIIVMNMYAVINLHKDLLKFDKFCYANDKKYLAILARN